MTRENELLDQLPSEVLGQRIAEARKASGVTQAQAASHLEMSRPTYISIEKGTRRATSEEIVKLAAWLGRSVHELVRPGAAAIQIEPHLRAVVDRSGKETEEVYKAIHELRRFAEDYRELEQTTGARPFENFPPEVRVPTARLADFAEDVAARERSRLQLGDGPVLRLRRLLEANVGVRVFCLATASNIAGMYAYVAELGYCILINAKHPLQRQRWTLAHEYGHFLADRHKPGIDYTGAEQRASSAERFSDAFARSFLMPATSVRRQFFEVVNARGDFQGADLCRLANFYGVSVQAMTLRLESLSLVRRGTWDLLAEQGFKPEAAKRDLELVPRETEQLKPYPIRYKYLCVLGFREGKLSEGQLAKYLRTDRVSARRIVHECTHLLDDIGPDGVEAALEVPLEQSLIAAP